ncbi:MAG: DNA mismatch repair endonuclease MutL [Verrucomicrobia bacterium]|nr:DNA mismatch repair endonuclease MutL [Verrucomicrobiota bacterium]
MSKIRVLPDRVANQIAAGEVIERPAAVVKELVENALDAGATRIEVEFNHGGRSYMRIEDNGSGMSRDDALLALERHATSKIAEADDLNRLATFGFRGEALPSIASVSHFTLQTREASTDAGVEIVINGGRMVHVRDCGRPVGTRIEVSHLFNSVPARRKFLKTDTTEAAHIIHGVRLYALAFPQVAFSLIEDGRAIFRSPQCTTFEERIAGIFGKQTAEGLLTLEADEPGMKLRGLVGRPGVGRSTRHEMICFVNQRPVDSRTLNYALIESFHESLPKGRYPVAFVFFDIDPAAVDVNVHPAKREVRFRSEASVRSFVIRAILGRLREFGQAAAPVAVGNGNAGAATIGDTGRIANQPLAPQVAPSVTSSVITAIPERRVKDNAPYLQPQAPIQPPSPTAATVAPTQPAPPRSPTRAWRFLGLAHGAYALFETPAGLVLLDRRAAHERIWFERLQAQFREGQVPSQRLLLPVPVELDSIATALLLDRLEFFNGHGFEIVEFGRNFFRIESVPAWMEPTDAEPFVRDLLGALREGRLQEKNVDVARDELARLAVAKAIRLPEAAGEAELQGVLTQLFACRAPLTSPLGRPTQIELSHGELARRFQK